MPTPRRIYLDNAATSWPKPETVYQAVDRYQRELGTSPSRSVYAEAIEADREIGAARAAVARVLNAEAPETIAMAFNCTDALNMAIHGLLRPGDHVVTSVVDHNSVLRPLRWLRDRGLIDVSYLPCDGQGIINPDDVGAVLRPDTRLLALVHASNVTGALQPVAEAATIARQHGVFCLIDAAQSVGHVPISVRAIDVDLLAAPGHKGLLGPLGTGFLYIRPGVERHLDSFRQGGTGTHSDQDLQPDALPDKYEPGNHNVLGICGLRAGIEYLEALGLAAVRNHEAALTERLLDGLSGIDDLTVHGPRNVARQVGVVSITHPACPPEEFARRLDASFRVQIRSGIHCAPRMHAALGTVSGGGTVRFSLGAFNTPEHVDRAVEAVGQIVAESHGRRRVATGP